MRSFHPQRARRWSAAVAAIVLAVALAACTSSEPSEKFQVSDITGVSWGRDFHLVDPAGIDPVRDVPAVLTQYVPSLGLPGDPPTIAATAKEFKVFYEAQKPGPSGFYTIDHQSGIFVFDARGRPRLFMGPNVWVDAMVHGLRLLLRESASENQ
jgi:cytochrome oxidase Cu insertion factor (SCO1/SenC/PrrC family)